MNFGFVVHPLSRLQRSLMGVRTLQPAMMLGLAGRTGRVARFGRIVSPAGAETRGDVRAVPLLPEALLRDQARAVEAIAAVVDRLAADGANVVGLGSLCAVVGLRGEEVAGRVKVPVTTGVSFTVFAACRTLERLAEALSETLSSARVAVAGAPGTVAVAIAERIAAEVGELSLVGRPASLERPARELKERTGREVKLSGEELAGADFVIGASSAGGALDPARLRPGQVVIDVAEPRDLPRRFRREGVLVVDGENVSCPPRFAEATSRLTRIYDYLVGQRAGTLYACFAEPIVLALEGKAERFSLGKKVFPEKVEEIGRLGEKHGFTVTRLLHRGRPLAPAELEGVASLRRRMMHAGA